MKFIRGDVVKTKLFIDGVEKWIEAFVDKAHEDPSCYDLSLSETETYGSEKIVKVSGEDIKPLFLTKDVEFLLQEGYSRQEIFTSLESANGDLDDALLYLHRNDRKSTTRNNTSQSLSSKDGISMSESAPSSNSTSYSHSLEPLKEVDIPRPSHTLKVKQLSPRYRKTSFCDDVKNLGKITIR